MKQAIMGISAFYHDSAAALIIDGKIVAAAHEERFTRKKHDSSFPQHACKFCLQQAGLNYNDLAAVAFYDKPYLKFERLLETYHAFAPRGLRSFYTAMPVWIREKLFMKKMLRDELLKLGEGSVPVYFPEHHLSHAASAFFPGPFAEAAILTIDGVGEWATTTICKGTANSVQILKELHFPHSAGLLYSAFTYYCGFRVNSGEYKLMGLAPYGNNNSDRFRTYLNYIKNELVDIREDGSLLLNMDYFDFAHDLKMTNNKKWQQLFNLAPREPESEIKQEYMDLALAIQRVTEEIIIKLARSARDLTQCRNLVMAGGVALNSVANGKLLRENIFENIWIQPAAGDAGGSLGAALAVWHIAMNKERLPLGADDGMHGACLGPEYSDKEIQKVLDKNEAVYTRYEDFASLSCDIARILADGNVVGWFQGRMEFGPRALGNRSILGDARNPQMQKKMNLKIKYREGFRPFAPAVLEEDVSEYFDLSTSSPYMLLVVPLKEDRRNPLPGHYNELSLYERLYFSRSDIPAVTHVDFSARVQSVSRDHNRRFWQLLKAFKKETGLGLLVNTSFNVRGQPIVCSPQEAWQCFLGTEMDFLVMGHYVINKKDQVNLDQSTDLKKAFNQQ